MLIEAFSEGKHPAAQELNEDALVILPGRAYAVIDGATDRSGRRYEAGRTSGKMAAAAVAGALNTAFGASTPAAPFDPARVVAALTQAIGAEYERLGITQLAAGDRNTRFNSTLALACTEAERVHLLLVGDSGIRINGATVYQESKLLDQVTADLRAAADRLLPASIADDAERDALAAHLAFRGTRHAPPELAAVLPHRALAAIEAETAAWYRTHHPEVPEDDLLSVIQGGILFGQSLHQNNTASVLGYSCLDGFPVPMALTRHITLPAAEVRSIELFSDGYFDLAPGLGVAAWEAMFQRVEQEDPRKLERYRSVKGSDRNGRKADDRSYLCIQTKP
jgi:hypothetical protein